MKEKLKSFFRFLGKSLKSWQSWVIFIALYFFTGGWFLYPLAYIFKSSWLNWLAITWSIGIGLATPIIPVIPLTIGLTIGIMGIKIKKEIKQGSNE